MVATATQPVAPRLAPTPPLKTLYSAVTKAQKDTNGLHVSGRDGESYLLEEQPTQQIYTFGRQTYRLWMPWTYYVMDIFFRGNGGTDYPQNITFKHIFWNNEPLRDSQQTFLASGLPNCGRDGSHPCFQRPDHMPTKVLAEARCEGYDSMFDYAAASLYENWWAGIGNADDWPGTGHFMTELCPQAKRDGWTLENRHAAFAAWEFLDRGQVLDAPMSPTKYNVQNIFPKTTKKVDFS